MIKLKVTKYKDGREVTHFRDTLGRRVRTGPTGTINWVQARQLAELSLYGIRLQREQVAAGLGSDGQAMPPLKRRIGRQGAAIRGGYPEFKQRLGLKPIRDLYGPGGLVVARGKTGKRYLRSGTAGSRALSGNRGHMLDDIRITSITDRQVQLGITTRASRTKALANQQRATWYGWSPSSLRKLSKRAAEIFKIGVAEQLWSLGLIGASALSSATRALRRAA